jgi:hypothetical protein
LKRPGNGDVVVNAGYSAHDVPPEMVTSPSSSILCLG